MKKGFIIIFLRIQTQTQFDDDGVCTIVLRQVNCGDHLREIRNIIGSLHHNITKFYFANCNSAVV